jgi:hypothetical protein
LSTFLVNAADISHVQQLPKICMLHLTTISVKKGCRARFRILHSEEFMRPSSLGIVWAVKLRTCRIVGGIRGKGTLGVW